MGTVGARLCSGRSPGVPCLTASDFDGSSPLARRLNTSWPLFRAFRVGVRVSWTIVVWP